MAPAREDNSNSYGGLGAGGKFRRHTSRRGGNSKPYDRPPTALRVPNNGGGSGGSGGSNGWLAKLVDPAQRLISYSAHRLFASVFRKRLAGPPHPPPQDVSPQPPGFAYSGKGEKDEHEEGVPLPKRAQVMMNGGNSGAGDSGRSIELEQTLKHMTFTKSEIDRLTALLHSKFVDMPSGQEEKKSQMTPSKLYCEGKDRLEITPVPLRENGVKSHLALTPAVNQSVHDEDVVSPTELAKSYMGNRISEASRRTDDSNLRGIRHIPQKSHSMSIVPRSAGPASASNNGFITPRSRGRSAIYNMARTPYARVTSRFSLKDAGVSVDINARPPSSESLSIWEQTKLSAPREGSLKRKSSVLENDGGSVGPIRRVHQKTNLLSSRSLMQRASVTSVSSARSRIDADTMRESRSSIESKHNMSLGNGENCTPATKVAPVQTKSSEMASKILQQLDKLVSSPTKMSPSGLSGKALRSLEKVDSSMFLDNVKDYNKVTQSSMFLHAFHDSAPQNLNKFEENGPKKLLGPPVRVTNSASVLDTSVSAKDTALSIKCADTDVTKCDAYNSQQKKRGFQMIAPDDNMDWDDDSYSDGVPLSIPAEDKGKKKDSELDSKIIIGEAIAIRQPQADSDIKHPPTAYTGLPDDSMAAEENAAFTFPSASPAAASVSSFSQQQLTHDKAALNAELNNTTLATSFGGKAASFAGPIAASSTPVFSFGDKVLQTKESNVSPTFSFGDKVNPLIEENAASPIISFESKNVNRTSDLACSSASSVPGQSCLEAGALPTSKSESSSSLAATSFGVRGATHLEPEKPKNNISKIPEAAFSLSALPSTSAPEIFPFGASSHGSLGTAFFSTISTSSPSDFTGQSPSSSSAFTTSFPVSTSTDVSGTTAPSSIRISGSSLSTGISTFSSAPALKFDSATVPSSMSSTVAVTSGAESDKKINYSTNFSNLSSSLLSSTSTVANTGSSVFGSAPATSSTTNNASQVSPFSSDFGVTTSSPFTAQASSAGSGAVTSTQSMPVQFGSSALSPSFGLGVSSGSSTSISLFSSSAATTNLFNGGNTCGQSSLASSSEANFGSSGGATTDISAAAVQPGKSPVFGSTSTDGFAFGASSTAAGASNAAPAVFESLNSYSSSSSFFSSTSSTSSTSAQPVFGNLSASSLPIFGGTSAASSHPIFGVGSAASASSQPIFGVASAASSQPIFGGVSAASSQPIFGGVSAASSQPIFGGAAAASSQTIFGGASASSQSTFGGTSASSQPAFGSTLAASQPAFGSTSTASQSAFGNHSFGSPFRSSSSGNNDQMSMEDSMAEDTVQASTPAPATSPFGQPPISPQQSGFGFGSTAPSGPSPFQFGSQQNLSTSQNPTPFQASGSLDFHAGGSFSLGSGGGDKSKRKIIKVKHRGRK